MIHHRGTEDTEETEETETQGSLIFQIIHRKSHIENSRNLILSASVFPVPLW